MTLFAGQLTGVEGYTESSATGLLAGINLARLLAGEDPVDSAADYYARRAVPLSQRGRPAPLPADERELRLARRARDARTRQASEARAVRGAIAARARRVEWREQSLGDGRRVRPRGRASRREPEKSSAHAIPVVPSPEVAEYLEHLRDERDVSPNTIVAYTRDLSELVYFLSSYYGGEGWSWQGVDRFAIRGFLAHLTRRGLSKRSTARALSAVRGFYRFLHRNEVVDANPARAVGSPKLERYLPSYLDRAQIDLVFPDGGGARVGGSLQRRSQPRDSGAVLLDRHAAVGAPGYQPRRSRSRLAAGEGDREGKEAAHHPGWRPCVARAPQLRGEAR